ncbi:peptidoglycan/xylan/chitin deacetylase (PgdA/CDA1 family) [Streptacidiphilus sp. MAP12-16]|uniref:polysaccharide deacetylase family protein n=1 Tax=Streptacidiphilus sp. MAP12-16 TaxID=3156300 RepID=UPI00351877F2
MRQPNLTTMPRPAVRIGPERLRGRTTRRLAVLTFRGVDDPAVFRAQAERLLRTANPVSLTQVQDALIGSTPLPPHAVLVTFEHGQRSAVTKALPVLATRGIPAVAFVVAELVDTERPYWWQEAEFLAGHGGRARDLSVRTPGGVAAALAALPDPDRRRSLEELRVTADCPAPNCAQLTAADLLALRDGGVEIGNHSLSHARLDQCDDYVVRAEVMGGHERLTQLTGEEPSAFAYPGGMPDRRADALLRGYGYRSAFLSDNHLFDLRASTSDALPDPLRISRLGVDAWTSRGMFDGVLSGWSPTVRRLRGAVAV